MKIAVIGGVAAGTSAAAKARRTDKDAEIVIFEKGKDISYAGCGLPYYISNLISERDKLLAFTGETFKDKYGVDVRLSHEVTEIDPQNKTLSYKNLKNKEEGCYEYDKLVIATGASPVKPPFTGIELGNIFTLRSVKSADKIKAVANAEENKEAVIIGAGLIGLEMAESFSEKGLKVKVVELEDQVLPPFSAEMAEIIAEHLREKNVELILDDGVDHFEGKEKVEKVVTGSGKELSADLVLLSIGIRPNSKLAADSGIETGETGAIAVNNKLETNIKDVYAAGDCAETVDRLTGKAIWLPLGSTANKQGRAAGENAAGGDSEHSGIIKTGITKIFDLTAARTGLSEEEAKEHGFDPVSVKIKAKNHAGYYPGAEVINIKGVFDRESKRILGAEVVGGPGSDKRIDVLIAAITAGMTADDLFQLDLAYAPPYSTPKDPVAVLGMVAQKKL